VVDTSDLFAALEGQHQTRGLERMCRLLGIPTQFMHNAGNDAYVSAKIFSSIWPFPLMLPQYTLLACKEMISGEPLDKQRDIRWPNQTGPDLQVKRQPWEEDSDYSDEEGLMPPMETGEYSDNLEM
jgi:hypothetical protein